ncbi:hypothetical protein HRI_001686900 [Hibiscus trionum]|uniref:Bet v I/Major latex protein domain-containing protein n=1 Tax=Hibiscus trionum TaxID=183268 RepID=A0A9W7HMS5_HIBTR|nr:hypothetical protein HRI_001686900 [Hibiscus trionum]
MGVVTYDFEVTSPIPPARLFKAIVLEYSKLYPTVAPQAIKSIEVEGDGGPGSIVTFNFAEGLPQQYVKVEGVDQSNFSYKYSIIKGGPLGDKLEKISYENKFTEAAGGGTVCKSLMKFYTVGDSVFTEEEIKALIKSTEGIYKALEAYLLANPDVCN